MSGPLGKWEAVVKQNLNRRFVLAGLAALPACRASGSKLDAQIIILGAGLAGLRAAQILSAGGKDVLVLEGSSRIGGRVHTLEHGELGFTEGGGAEIKPNYARVIRAAKAANLKLIKSTTDDRQTAYYYQGQSYMPEAWKRSVKPNFPAPFGTAVPTAPLTELAAKANPLKAPEDWSRSKFNSYDISAQDFLLKAGFQGDAQKLIEQSFDGNLLRNFSMMNLYRNAALNAQSNDVGESLIVEGGAQRLPEAMAQSLPRAVMLGQMVKTITSESDKVIIETAGGKTYCAAQCLCALPFGALRNVSIKAFMPQAQSAAIRELPHTQVLQIHLKADSAFWDKDGLPANMWTDLPLEQIFAELDAQGQPTGLFRVSINGRGATRSVWEDRAALPERLGAYMKTVRPASEGKFDVLAVQDWTTKNTLAGGAYSHWAPGQITQWAEDMGRPGSNLAFAGDQFGRGHTGMEGAMESAENAARQLLAQ